MSTKSFLIVDVNFLANRAFHSTPNLSYHAVRTGVIFGVLRDIENLRDTFMSNVIVLCFDCGITKRKEMFAGYKEKRHDKRKEWTEEEWAAYKELQSQMYILRTMYLGQIGYRNVFFAKGFESDDIVASVIERNVSENDEAVIVSADKDFYQLLAPNVVMHNPNLKSTMTALGFRKEYGIEPRQWARVLAIAGCRTDEVPGIPGFGPKTAIKYILGTLKSEKLVQRAASDRGRERIARNKALVKLPLPDTPAFQIKQDEITAEGWQKVMNHLGIKSISFQERRRTLWD